MIKTKWNNIEPDYLYYDISIFNNTESGVTEKFPLSFTETRPEDFIERCGNYYLSVVRFNLGLSNLPSFIPRIEGNQPDINKTIYKLILKIAGVTTVLNVYWETQNPLVPLPSSPVIDQEFSEYYFSNSYEHFLKILNSTIIDANILGTETCYFQLNPDTNNIELITSASFAGPSPTCEIGMNDPLKNLFSTFSFVVKPKPSLVVYPYQYWWNIEFPINAKIYNVALDLYILSTYTCPLALWNPVASIVFTSTTIPVVPNAVGPQKQFATNKILPSQENSNNVLNTITDFEVDIGPNSYYKPNISYLPTAQYRMIQLYGNSGMNQIQINVYWKDNHGGLHLIELGNNCIGNIKLMFVKRTASQF